MSIEIESDFSELEELGRDLEGMSETVQAQVPGVMKTAILIPERAAKTLAPVGVSGRLRATITSEVRGVAAETVGVVGPNVKYAPPVELGSKPFWPPWGPGTSLARWAQLKGLSAFLVARAISRKGIRAQEFLQRAFASTKSDVIKVFVNWVKEIKIDG